MMAISIGSILHKSQDMEWNPYLQGTWATSGAIIYLLLRQVVRYAQAE